MIDSHHIIEKVFVEVNTRKMETAQTIKNNVDEFLRNELFPKLELLFNEYEVSESVLRFDKINIDLSVNNSRNFESVKYEIAKQFEEKIKVKIEPVLQSQYDIPEKFVDQVYGSESGKTGFKKISLVRNRKFTFLFFLANGYLPWFGKEEQINEISFFKNWIEALENPIFIDEIRTVFNRENATIDRFVNQFSVENVVAFLTKINQETKNYQQQILDWIYKNEPTINQLFLKLLIQISLEFKIESITNRTRILFYEIAKNIKLTDEVSVTENYLQLVFLLRKFLPEMVKTDKYFLEKFKILTVENPTKKEIKKAFSDIKSTYREDFSEKTVLDENQFDPNKKEFFSTSAPSVQVKKSEDVSFKEIQSAQDKTEHFFSETKTNEIAVQNAGIIITHPFLKYFFMNSGIADKTGKLINEKLDLAVQSIHFMATGNENVFEGNLVLEKFLCGVPLKRPVKKRSLLTNEIREEVEVMLKEIIRNWPALKNSSVNDLRQMFFQRDGKLIPMENKYKLLVERKAQDILLEKLSWNISIIKLPWIKEIIIVEW